MASRLLKRYLLLNLSFGTFSCIISHMKTRLISWLHSQHSTGVLSVWYKTKFGSQKFWLPKLVTLGHSLPKLVANISSQFHRLVNTGLAVGSLVKWLPIKVANPSKIDKFAWFIAPRLQMAPSNCNHLWNTMPCEILHPMVWGTSVNSLVLILKAINLFLPCKLIFRKSYQSW